VPAPLPDILIVVASDFGSHFASWQANDSAACDRGGNVSATAGSDIEIVLKQRQPIEAGAVTEERR
jgi:hypothetical protein